jgi:radical SAM enzyme (TIGR01210 family)
VSVYLNVNGCSWNKCKFCAYEHMKKDGIPTKDQLSSLIQKEMEKVNSGKQKYVKIFNGGSWFYNEVPSYMKEWVYEYLENINFKKLRIENTFNLLNWEEVENLVNRGFDLTISWGLEVANDEILKNINKGIVLKKVEKVLERAKLLGINNLTYILAGLPETNNETFKSTIDWVCHRKKLIDEISVLTFVPIKGSFYYDNLWKTNKFRVINKEDWKICREYVKEKCSFNNINYQFETYNWRFLQGKTYDQLYKKDKR